MDTTTLILFLFGLVFLIVGAELLVRGASRLAAAVGVSPLVIGLTVVAYGTSSPELAVSVQSAFTGQADIALGNVVGSNIFNVLLILGVSALVAPLLVAQQLIWLDVPIMIGVSLITFFIALDGVIGRFDGAFLFIGAIIYTVFLIRQSRKEGKEIKDEYAQEFGANGSQSPGSIVLQLGFIIAGLGLLVLGSSWLVNGAIEIARWFGVSELVIGLTIIAAGTSLPEVATSVLASVRGERDIAVGNVVGSNIFNLLAVLGLAGLLAPGGVSVAPAVLSFDLPVMIAVAVACLPIFFTGHLINRWEGALFFGYYLAYTLYLILATAKHDALPQFSLLMLEFVIPLTVLTLAIVTIRSLRASRSNTSVGK
jgi:cation:H+ antiporter